MLDEERGGRRAAVTMALSRHGDTRLETPDVSAEVRPRRGPTGSGIEWSVSRFESRGTDAIEVLGSRETDFLFTQVPLTGGFEVELADGLRYCASSSALIRPKWPGATFRFYRNRNTLFGTLVSLETLGRWFGDRLSPGIRALASDRIDQSARLNAPLPPHLRTSIQQALSDEGPLSALTQEAVALQVLSHHIAPLHDGIERGVTAREAAAAREARAMIADRVEAPPLMAELAKACGLSVRRLDAAIREVYDTSPHGLLQHLRFESACDGLEAGEPIKAVAHRLGYSNVSNFTSAFRRRFGIPPGQWATRAIH